MLLSMYNPLIDIYIVYIFVPQKNLAYRQVLFADDGWSSINANASHYTHLTLYWPTCHFGQVILRHQNEEEIQSNLGEIIMQKKSRFFNIYTVGSERISYNTD